MAAKEVRKERERVTLIPLADIINKFDVRTKLDDDRVVQFAEMYENGNDVPPVKLIRLDNTDPVTYAYLDGRHRGAAREYLNMKDVPAILVDASLNDDPLELYTQALEANWGGAKPPSREDITHTITRMLEAGVSRTAIKDRLTFIPSGALRAFIASALSTISKRRTTKALDMLSEGLNVEAAAKEAKIKPEILKAVIAGKKGRWGKNRSLETQRAIELKTHISKVLRSANTSISKKIEEFLRSVNDGEISPALGKEVIEAWDEHLRKTQTRVKDWYARLEMISQDTKKSVA